MLGITQDLLHAPCWSLLWLTLYLTLSPPPTAQQTPPGAVPTPCFRRFPLAPQPQPDPTYLYLQLAYVIHRPGLVVVVIVGHGAEAARPLLVGDATLWQVLHGPGAPNPVLGDPGGHVGGIEVFTFKDFHVDQIRSLQGEYGHFWGDLDLLPPISSLSAHEFFLLSALSLISLLKQGGLEAWPWNTPIFGVTECASL